MIRNSLTLLVVIFLPTQITAQSERDGATTPDLPKAKLLSRTEIPKHVGTVRYSPDGKHLIVSSGGSTLWVGNKDGENLRILAKPPRGYWGIALSPNGKRLAVACHDVTVRILHFPSGKGDFSFESWSRRISSAIAYSPDGSMLAVGGEDGMITLCEAATGRRIRSIDPQTEYQGTRTVQSLTFSPNGKLLGSGGADRSARIWDVASGAQLFAYINLKGYHVNAVAFSPNGRMFAAVGNDFSVRVWEVCSGKVRWHLPMKTTSGALAFSPDARSLVVGGSNNRQLQGEETSFWHLHTGRKVAEVATGGTRVWSLAFSPSGKTLACTENSKQTHQLSIWRVPDLYKEETAHKPTKTIDALLDDMSGADAVVAYKAILSLSRCEQSTTALQLRIERIRKAVCQRNKDIGELVRGLDSDDFRRRETAAKKLSEFGIEAAWGLQSRMKNGGSLEFRKRAANLLPVLYAKGHSAPVCFIIRAIECLEMQDTSAAEQLLRKLSKELPPQLAGEAIDALNFLVKGKN